jgi:hypothetical protein
LSNGFPIEEAVRLRDQYPTNVRNRYVGMNRRDSIQAVMDPRLDVITAYHGQTAPDKLERYWRRKNPQLVGLLGDEGTKELSQSFQSTKSVGNWINGVAQRDVDAVFGKGEVALEDWQKLARKKMCCQTGRCGTSGAKCGFGLLSE